MRLSPIRYSLRRHGASLYDSCRRWIHCPLEQLKDRQKRVVSIIRILLLPDQELVAHSLQPDSLQAREMDVPVPKHPPSSACYPTRQACWLWYGQPPFLLAPKEACPVLEKLSWSIVTADQPDFQPPLGKRLQGGSVQAISRPKTGSMEQYRSVTLHLLTGYYRRCSPSAFL